MTARLCSEPGYHQRTLSSGNRGNGVLLMSELEVDGRIHVTQGEATITFRGPGRLVMPDRAVGTCLCLLSDPPQFQFQVAEGESVRFTPEKSSADLASENGQNCDDTSTNS